MMLTALAVPCLAALLQLPDSDRVLPRVPLGANIRIETSSVRDGSLEGALVEKNQGFLRAAVAREVSISVPWSRINSLSADAGRERKTGAARGTLAGASAALVISSSLSHPTAAVAAGMVLPVAGGVVGWLAGLERWEPVLWRPAIDSVMEREATRLHIEPGAHVAVRVARRLHRGHVRSVSDDSLTLRQHAVESRYAWAHVSELRVPGGRNRLRGAALGFSAMAVASGIHLLAAKPEGGDRHRIVIGYALGGGLVGALIGAPAWHRLPVPVR
jgi:hypothetical protein